jgi:hypothetical protein
VTDKKNSKPEVTKFGIVVGTVTGFQDDATPLIAIEGQAACPARTVVNLQSHHVGESVVVQFEQGNPMLPVVIGLIKTLTPASAQDADLLTTAHPATAKVDEDTLVLSAKRRVILQCGRASITLDDKGHVEIRGTYVLSRSSGQNRIKGGSVSLN